MTRKLSWLAAAAFVLGSLLPAQAWNSTGHMTIADIAYDHLTAKTRASVDALLAHQRDYPLWMSEMPAGYTDRARFAFMKAATWPDDIRKTPDDRPIWHYIDIPVIAPGFTPDPIVLLPVRPNAETQTVAETALLTAPAATAGERAVALCWVEHLVGDVHQPLHDASLFSPQFSQGDKGGNLEWLAANAVASDPLETQANPHKLHALWDDALGNTLDPVAIQKIAATLETSAYHRAAFPQLKAHPAVHDWILEGSVLAKQDAYWNFALPMVTAPDGKINVTLPEGYLVNLHKISNQQIALAGLRLADLLNAQTFPQDSGQPAPN